MSIFINDTKINNINEIYVDPSIEMAREMWGSRGVIEKSAIDLRRLYTPFGSISLLYGPRQIGKTASLKLFLSECSDSDTLIYTDCSTILERRDLAEHLAKRIDRHTTIVLDEVQEVDGWHLALRTLYSEGKLKNCRIWCTGSEARYLLESGERLPGRKGLGQVLFARPWSFREYVTFFYPEAAASFESINFKHVNQKWLEAQEPVFTEAWREYLLTGGIPRAVGDYRTKGKISDLTWRIYIDWILGTWSKHRTPMRSLGALARRICETLNSRVSFDALRKGTDIQSPATVRVLLEAQEDHFSLKTISRFDIESGKFLTGKQKKIYPIDPFIARIWACIGWDVRRVFEENLPTFSLDECAFMAQTHRHLEGKELSYLYSERKASEIDFYFDECGFELKSGGNPSKHQWEILNRCPQAFVVRRTHLPLMAYLIGGVRNEPS